MIKRIIDTQSVEDYRQVVFSTNMSLLLKSKLRGQGTLKNKIQLFILTEFISKDKSYYGNKKHENNTVQTQSPNVPG
jgi:hypothetical protein